MTGQQELMGLSNPAAQSLANRFVGFYKQLVETVQEWLDLQVALDTDQSTLNLISDLQKTCPTLTAADARVVAYMLKRNIENTEHYLNAGICSTPNNLASTPFWSVMMLGGVVKRMVLDANLSANL